MPSKERFQTRPMGRAFKRCLLSRNFLFRGRQQPKLRKLDVLCFLVWFLADAGDSNTKSGRRQYHFDTPPRARVRESSGAQDLARF
jgi:hypothetical protein